jgi:hypothetical protein
MRTLCISFCLLTAVTVWGQKAAIDSFHFGADIKVTIDARRKSTKKTTIIIFYALPNGNSTEQTMGKKMEPGDDWHFDIQHIRAQTDFIRNSDRSRNYVTVYLETKQRSWPAWKRAHQDFRQILPALIDSICSRVPAQSKVIYLNGHSGGGSFLFGLIDSYAAIPLSIERISFIDSNYGYDSSYYPKLKQWLGASRRSKLTVFAYNDSIALYNGKPVVSAHGGTWYRSHLMLEHFGRSNVFTATESDSLNLYANAERNILFALKKNSDRGIYHTQQVERNGFIHSVLWGTKKENRGYSYYGPRSYYPDR